MQGNSAISIPKDLVIFPGQAVRIGTVPKKSGWMVTLVRYKLSRDSVTFKVGQNQDRVRNAGQFSIPKDLVIFPGQAVRIRDCPEKIGMDGHLNKIQTQQRLSGRY